MKVWLVMMWDYSQTTLIGVYDSIEAVLAAHPEPAWERREDGSWKQPGPQGYEATEEEVVTAVSRRTSEHTEST